MSALIGVLGGTFNPIHLGHLNIAQQVAQALDFDQVRFIPAAHPPHKPTPLVSAEQRANMVQLAIKDYPNFVLDRTELERTGPSYTVDTLKQLQIAHPQSTFCLILGWDAFSNIHTWYQWQAIFTLAHIALVQRPQQQLSKLPVVINTEFDHRRVPITEAKHLMQSESAGLICQIPTDPLAISSTDIRQKIALGQLPQSQLPSAVIDYIALHQLYQS